MAYILENEQEFQRLEKQSKLPHYSIEAELKYFPKLNEGTRILDAGCGSGLLARHLSSEYSNVEIEACDFSELRLHQAQTFCRKNFITGVNFFHANLEEIDRPDETYDTIFCRYVLEHLQHPEKVIEEFKRILKPNGTICLIDLEGVIYNITTQNKKFHSLLEDVENGLSFDLRIGKKMPLLLSQAGFKNIKWDAETLYFQDEALDNEVTLTKERLEQSRPILSQILKEETDLFIDSYLEEMVKPETTLYYTKFLVQANI